MVREIGNGCDDECCDGDPGCQSNRIRYGCREGLKQKRCASKVGHCNQHRHVPCFVVMPQEQPQQHTVSRREESDARQTRIPISFCNDRGAYQRVFCHLGRRISQLNGVNARLKTHYALVRKPEHSRNPVNKGAWHALMIILRHLAWHLVYSLREGDQVAHPACRARRVVACVFVLRIVAYVFASNVVACVLVVRHAGPRQRAGVPCHSAPRALPPVSDRVLRHQRHREAVAL